MSKFKKKLDEVNVHNTVESYKETDMNILECVRQMRDELRAIRKRAKARPDPRTIPGLERAKTVPEEIADEKKVKDLCYSLCNVLSHQAKAIAMLKEADARIEAIRLEKGLDKESFPAITDDELDRMMSKSQEFAAEQFLIARDLKKQLS